ncbi:STYKc [Musa troglodytarum]|uniref:STYKc n=1 Tax=Musa troglodytarum TaxID=320322 RepID=A0A9E7G9U2_9LILI|nr:STYKc [Musa troglodytarum]
MHHPWPTPSFRLLLPFLLSLSLSSLPPSFSDDDYLWLYRACAPRPFPCGSSNFRFSYPFSHQDSPSECGYPETALSCNTTDDTLTIHIGNKQYRVKDNNIDYANYLVTVVDQDFLGNHCPRPSENTTLGSAPFQYTGDDVNATFFIDCPLSLPSPLIFVDCLGYDNTAGWWSYYWSGNGNLPANAYTCRRSFVQVPMNRTTLERWIDGDTSYADALQEGFTLSWPAEIGVWCSACNGSGGVCGYISSNPTCFCSDGSATDGSLAGSVGFVLVCIALFLCTRKRYTGSIIYWNKPTNVAKIEDFLNDYGSLAPKRYKYSELKKMTKSFKEKLGEGGYGSVFKGTLQDGRLVAVKILSKSKDNGAEFINEVASIGRTSHVNVVSLLGFCLDGHKRALVYEFMPNGSLDKYIYSDNPKASLPWDRLYHIAVGIARGLEYLHRGCNTRIVHFDIKPHNILLDADFCPKISDFGLAKLCPPKESILSMADARGTIGYIAPEVFSRSFGMASTKSDVYSYGMMVLEMAGGRRNVKAWAERTSEIYFPHWVYDHLDRDGGLEAYDVTAETEEIGRKMAMVGLWCIQTMPPSRPSMSRVVEMLEGRVSDMEMPPKPYLSSPQRPVVVTSSC